MDTFRRWPRNEADEPLEQIGIEKKNGNTGEGTSWRDRKWTKGSRSTFGRRDDSVARPSSGLDRFQHSCDADDQKSWRDPTHRKSSKEFPFMSKDTIGIGSVSALRGAADRYPNQDSIKARRDGDPDLERNWRDPEHRKSRKEFPVMIENARESSVSDPKPNVGIRIDYVKPNLHFLNKTELIPILTPTEIALNKDGEHTKVARPIIAMNKDGQLPNLIPAETALKSDRQIHKATPTEFSVNEDELLPERSRTDVALNKYELSPERISTEIALNEEEPLPELTRAGIDMTKDEQLPKATTTEITLYKAELSLEHTRTGIDMTKDGQLPKATTTEVALNKDNLNPEPTPTKVAPNEDQKLPTLPPTEKERVEDYQCCSKEHPYKEVVTKDFNFIPKFFSSLKVSEKINTCTLKSWAENEDIDDVTLKLFSELDSVERLLKADTLEEEWYTRLVQVLAAIMDCEVHSVEVTIILRMISTSHFLTHLLSNYLDQKCEQEMTWTSAEEFFKSLVKIVQNIAKRVPEKVQNCKPPLKNLQRIVEYIDSVRDNQEIKALITSAMEIVTGVQKTQSDRKTGTARYGPNFDNDTPPENFTELSVIPTASDLSPNARSFVRAAITKGPYRSHEHYLDIQFRLMREDFVKPLRRGLHQFREHGHEKSFKCTDLHIYRDVRFVGMTHVKGISHVIQFDVSNMKNVKWDHCKLLLNGNLLCLSSDNFESVLIFATVSLRDPELLRDGIISIECISGLEALLKSSPNTPFVMTETTAYYEAVHPILKGLQTIDPDFPMKQYIIFCQTQLRPPTYLLQGVRKYNISCLMNSPSLTEVSVLNTSSWPPAEDMCLNASQREAAMLALTKEISVIQGPPGTGKTYVGLKVMRVLLENQDRMLANEKRGNDPILVICYTNHALDQFLEGILGFCPNDIVRVGGNKSSEALRPFNLMELAKQRGSASKHDIWEFYDALNRCASLIADSKEKLDSLTTEVVEETKLSRFICETHRNSLNAGPCDENSKSKIHQWLNAPNESFSQRLEEIIQHHLTKVVMDCLHFTSSFHLNDLRLRGEQPIVERVVIYRQWLSGYQRCLKNELRSKTSDAERQFDKDYLSALYNRSFRPAILNDSEICNVIPPACYDIIKNAIDKEPNDTRPSFMRATISKKKNCYAEKDQLIVAWVLGLHNDNSTKLDEYKELKRFLQTFKPVEKTSEEGFDDEEESQNAMKHRQLFEDDDHKKTLLDATMKVKKARSFVVNRMRRLGMNATSDNGESVHQQDNDGFQTVSRKKPRTFSRVERYLSDDKSPPMSHEEEQAITDVWALAMKDRLALYKLWINQYKEHIIVSDVEDCLADYNETKQNLREVRMKDEVRVLSRAKIIGMTTTGAAKHRALLETVRPRIIVVEEAAEVLEAHIVTALNQNCKHLILIGDHKQLRPSTTVYEHAKNYGLDVSLFERLINNDIPHVTLCEQHRMRESISVIMRHIYPNLEDHISVKAYKNVRGVSKNVFFIQHNQAETTVKDSLSKSNPFEAKYLVELCHYFLKQGYEPSQITILATYGGQVLRLKKEMKERQVTKEVRVSTVDNFQGEENDIILLSLVRSNEQGIAGFLKVDNRVCVALSRARLGLFAIGNLALLASQSKLWNKIKHTAEDEGITGNGLPISCPNHPDEKNVIKVPTDFDCCPEGGCLKKCDFRLECGHICPLLCHGYDLQHIKIMCQARCLRSCPEGHPCPKPCYQDCEDCTVKVEKLVPECGHSNYFMCSKDPKETDCYSQCDAILPCDHRCTGKCGECKTNGRHKQCQVPVIYLWPCGHAVKVPCHKSPAENPCPQPCGEMLECGHACVGTCSDCLEGAVHAACTKTCRKKLFCGHECQDVCGAPCNPCSAPCPVACRHSSCSHKTNKQPCGAPCIPCTEPCANRCRHRQCSHPCHRKCDVEPCERPCGKIISSCGHRCAGLCGEICVCRECQRISRCEKSDDKEKISAHAIKCKSKLLFRIPSCWHVFILEDIDEHVARMDKKDSTEFLRCPQCSVPIQKCHRYDHVLKNRQGKREAEKTKTAQQKALIRLLRTSRIFKDSLKVVQENDPDDFWVDFKDMNLKYYSKSGEYTSLALKLKFAYVINVIVSLEYKEVTDTDVNNRVTSLLKIGFHFSPQQIEEYKRDLKRLLLFHYAGMLPRLIATDNGLNLSQDLAESCAEMREGMRVVKPTADVIDRGISALKSLEKSIEKEISDRPFLTSLLLSKEKMVNTAVDVLNAANEEMLTEIIDDASDESDVDDLLLL